jgi:hypothetical protein
MWVQGETEEGFFLRDFGAMKKPEAAGLPPLAEDQA